MGNSYSQPRNLSHITQHPSCFPPELLLLVLEAAYCQPDTPIVERCAGLCAAALVSLAWLGPAQQLLWHSVDIRGISQLRALRAICEAESRGTELAAHARTLSICNRLGEPCTMHDIARLLRRLPRVEQLHLIRPPSDLPDCASFDLQIAVTRRPDVPKLTTLRVSFAPTALVHKLLRILPSLRFVEVSMSLRDDDIEHQPPTGSGPYCKLYELRWGAGSNVHAAHALGFSLGTLRILALHSLPPDFPALMRTYGPRLRSLRVFRYDPSLALAVRHCTALEEFIMQDHIPPEALLAELPPTLQHLAVDCDDVHQHNKLAALVKWVRGPGAKLRVLTCFSPDESNPDWPDFVRACQHSGVELRCFKGWHGLYENVDEELGEVDRFPRPVPYHAQRLLQLGDA